jgi:hypothetical protein
MRLRLLIPCAATIALAALPAAPASAAAKKTCAARDHTFVQYQVLSGSSRGITCSSTAAVLLKGVLDQKPPAGWRCRVSRASEWPKVSTCDRRVRGRRVATASLFTTPDFYTAPVSGAATSG